MLPQDVRNEHRVGPILVPGKQMRDDEPERTVGSGLSTEDQNPDNVVGLGAAVPGRQPSPQLTGSGLTNEPVKLPHGSDKLINVTVDHPLTSTGQRRDVLHRHAKLVAHHGKRKPNGELTDKVDFIRQRTKKLPRNTFNAPPTGLKHLGGKQRRVRLTQRPMSLPIKSGKGWLLGPGRLEPQHPPPPPLGREGSVLTDARISKHLPRKAFVSNHPHGPDRPVNNPNGRLVVEVVVPKPEFLYAKYPHGAKVGV